MLSDSKGFSLLEVIIALAIMSGGFLTVLQLYSMSIRTLRLSEQNFKAVMLAQSKMAELELVNFNIEEKEGTFNYDKDYQWKVEISPHESPLNSDADNLQLIFIKVIVFWGEENNVHASSLATIKLDTTTYPIADKRLEEMFKGGQTIGASDSDLDNDVEPPKGPSSPPNNAPQRLCGGIGGVRAPCPVLKPKKKPCPSGKVYLIGAGCQ
jgi:general secretion pathway protein I